jgi:hypothetical protein
MKKIITILALAVILVSACSKDQKVVKQLDGEWKTTAVKVNGVSVDMSAYGDVRYKFTKCKVSKGDCDGTLISQDPTKGSIETSFTYNIENDGKTINIKYSFLGFTTSIKGDIIEQTKTTFIYEYTNTETIDEYDSTTGTWIEKKVTTTTQETLSKI